MNYSMTFISPLVAEKFNQELPLRWGYEKRTLGEAENKEKGSTESKTNHTVLLAKPYSYLPATSDRGGTG